MKKLLFVIHTLGGGGAEKALVNLVNNMNPKKFDITVMTIIDTGILRYSLNNNIKYKTILKIGRSNKQRHSQKASDSQSGSLLNNSSKLTLACAKIYAFMWRHMPTKFLYRVVVREKYDYEIAFLEGICAKFVAASNDKKSKKIAWIHVDLINQNKSSKVFKNLNQEKSVYSRFDKIICVSNTVREQFCKKYKISEEKVAVKYNVIDDREIIRKSSKKSDFRKEPGTFLFCSIGRLNKQKSYGRLLNAFARLVKEFPYIRLVIVGEGTDRDNLETFIKERNLSDKITLAGFQSNPYPYLAASDIFVCSSVAEGFSTAVSEAVILGKPVVTTRCSGMDEILGSPSKCGVITDNSEDGLYEGLRNILSEPKRFRLYQEQAKKRSKIFSASAATNEIENIFLEGARQK